MSVLGRAFKKLSAASNRKGDRGGSARANTIIGLVAMAAMLILVLLVFVNTGIGKSGRIVSVDFENVLNVQSRTPVRIAGITVGEVTGISRGKGNLGRVTMRIRSDAPELRKGTRFAIRPRTFLEGAFYLEVSPAPSSAKKMADGEAFPVSSSSYSVGLDQVVGSVDKDTRDSLRATIKQVEQALPPEGWKAKDVLEDLEPTTRDVRRLLAAIKSRPGYSIRDTIRNLRTTARAGAATRKELASAIDSTSVLAGDVATRSQQVNEILVAVAELSDSAPTVLKSVENLLPQARQALKASGPLADRAPGLLKSSSGLLARGEKLLAPDALPKVLDQATPVVNKLPRIVNSSLPLLPRVQDLLVCVNNQILPAFDYQVPDGALSSGTSTWNELTSGATSLSGVAQTFDANGPLARLTAAIGPRVFSSGPTADGGEGPYIATSEQPLLGARPVWYGSKGVPPIRPDQKCKDQVRKVDLTANSGKVSQSLGTSSISDVLIQNGWMLGEKAFWDTMNGSPSLKAALDEVIGVNNGSPNKIENGIGAGRPTLGDGQSYDLESADVKKLLDLYLKNLEDNKETNLSKFPAANDKGAAVWQDGVPDAFDSLFGTASKILNDVWKTYPTQ